MTVPATADAQGQGLSSRLWSMLKEVLVVAAMALVISFVLKTWFIQAFYIPSGSMENTLLVGDRVVVNKLVPRTEDLRRGDVVVFEDPGGWLPPTAAPNRGPIVSGVERGLSWIGLLPDSAENHLIKRVIGLPGDKVSCCDSQGRLAVNGVPIEETYIHPGDLPSDMPFEVTVPAGRVWVMGDHRSDSDDSRFHDTDGNGGNGAIPIDRITGRAFAIIWPLGQWGSPQAPSGTFATVPAP